jgi:hypothetical protein
LNKIINIRTRTGIEQQICYDQIMIGDSNAYHLVIELADLEAITGNVILRFVRSDEVTLETIVPAEDVIGNKIYHTLTEQETAVASPLMMYIRFAEDNLYTPTLIVFVNVRILAGHDLTPTEEDQDVIGQIVTIFGAENDRVAAEAARVSAEEDRVDAETLRDSAETARDNAEGLRETAETTRDGAEQLRLSAETARDSAEQLRLSAETARASAEGIRDAAETDRIAAETARQVWEAFDPAEVYQIGNKVSYQGSSYYMHTVSGVAGTLPTDVNHWLLIAAQGDVSAQQLSDAIDTHNEDTSIWLHMNVLGTRLYTEKNFISSSQPMTDSIDILDRKLFGRTIKTYEYGREIPFTWAQIQTKCLAGDFSDISVGDWKPLTLTTSETVIMEVAGIDTYYGYASNGKHNIDFISRDCLSAAYQYNTTNTNIGGWLASSLYTAMNGTGGIYDKLPSDVKAVIGPKLMLLENKAAADSTTWAWHTETKLWLPAELEVFGYQSWSEIGYGSGNFKQYPLFAGSEKHIIKGAGNGGSASSWWELSPRRASTASFCYVHYYGVAGNNSASAAYRIPLCFRVS